MDAVAGSTAYSLLRYITDGAHELTDRGKSFSLSSLLMPIYYLVSSGRYKEQRRTALGDESGRVLADGVTLPEEMVALNAATFGVYALTLSRFLETLNHGFRAKTLATLFRPRQPSCKPVLFVDTDVIYSHLYASRLIPAFVVYRDRAAKRLVVALRGTASLHDIVADMAGTATPFLGGTRAHTGMAACAHALMSARFSAMAQRHVRIPPLPRREGNGAADASSAPPSWPFPGPSFLSGDGSIPVIAFKDGDTSAGVGVTRRAALSLPGERYDARLGLGAVLQRALDAYGPDWSIAVCGHSLGAGIGAILVALLRAVLKTPETPSLARLRGALPAVPSVAAPTTGEGGAEQSTSPEAQAEEGDDGSGSDEDSDFGDEEEEKSKPALPAAAEAEDTAPAPAAATPATPAGKPLLASPHGSVGSSASGSGGAGASPSPASPRKQAAAAAAASPFPTGLDALWRVATCPVRVRGYLAATPACVSPELSAVLALEDVTGGRVLDPTTSATEPLPLRFAGTSGSAICSTVVLHDDIVPRLTVSSMRALYSELATPTLIVTATKTLRAEALGTLSARAASISAASTQAVEWVKSTVGTWWASVGPKSTATAAAGNGGAGSQTSGAEAAATTTEVTEVAAAVTTTSTTTDVVEAIGAESPQEAAAQAALLVEREQTAPTEADAGDSATSSDAPASSSSSSSSAGPVETAIASALMISAALSNISSWTPAADDLWDGTLDPRDAEDDGSSSDSAKAGAGGEGGGDSTTQLPAAFQDILCGLRIAAPTEGTRGGDAPAPAVAEKKDAPVPAAVPAPAAPAPSAPVLNLFRKVATAFKFLGAGEGADAVPSLKQAYEETAAAASTGGGSDAAAAAPADGDSAGRPKSPAPAPPSAPSALFSGFVSAFSAVVQPDSMPSEGGKGSSSSGGGLQEEEEEEDAVGGSHNQRATPFTGVSTATLRRVASMSASEALDELAEQEEGGEEEQAAASTSARSPSPPPLLAERSPSPDAPDADVPTPVSPPALAATPADLARLSAYIKAWVPVHCLPTQALVPAGALFHIERREAATSSEAAAEPVPQTPMTPGTAAAVHDAVSSTVAALDVAGTEGGVSSAAVVRDVEASLASHRLAVRLVTARSFASIVVSPSMVKDHLKKEYAGILGGMAAGISGSSKA